MTIRFIGQGYSGSGSTSSLAQELIMLLANKDYNEFRCLVAFASVAGVYGLAKHIRSAHKKHLKTVQMIVGIDQDGTSKEALEELLLCEVPCYVYHTESSITFHPKVYFFKGKKKSAIIIGSNNLTQFGLGQNVEGSLLVEFDNTDSAAAGAMAQIESYFAPILNGTEPNLRKLDKSQIEWLVDNYKLPTEADQMARYAARSKAPVNSAKAATGITNPFTKPAPQKLPAGFDVKKRRSGADVEVPSVPDGDAAPASTSTTAAATLPAVTPTVALSRHFSEADLTFVSEMNGPTRYGQFSPIHRIFENFFGGRFDTVDRFVDLICVADDATRTLEPARKIGHKSSGNATIEFGAAAIKSFATPNRPIAAFIRIRADQFFYYLAEQTDSTYAELQAVVTGSGNDLKRAELTVAQLRRACPSLPFWRMS